MIRQLKDRDQQNFPSLCVSVVTEIRTGPQIYNVVKLEVLYARYAELDLDLLKTMLRRYLIGRESDKKYTMFPRS